MSNLDNSDDYQEIAPYYDLEFDAFNDDIEMYSGYVSIMGSPVLELGCGTGRILKELFERHTDISLFGLDNSTSMLQQARQRAPEVKLIEGDMSDFSLDHSEPFKLIFCAVNSFLHLGDRKDQLECLRSVERHLDRNGLLILDVLHPTPGFLHDIDERVRHDHTWTTDRELTVSRFSHRQIDVSEQRITTHLMYDLTRSDGSMRRTQTSYWMRYIHRFELEGLLDQAGFELEGIYGSYQLDPLDDDSSQMIFVAHRRARADEDPLL